jgi:hypothetical protein
MAFFLGLVVIFLQILDLFYGFWISMDVDASLNSFELIMVFDNGPFIRILSNNPVLLVQIYEKPFFLRLNIVEIVQGLRNLFGRLRFRNILFARVLA